MKERVLSLTPERVITESKLRQMFSRMYEVAMLNRNTFLGLKEDENATGQAVAVLFLVIISYGIGYGIWLGFQPGGDPSLYTIISVVLYRLIIGMLAGLVWSFTAFLIGTKLFKGVTSYWGLVRPLFFSTTPGILFLLIAIPVRAVTVGTTIVAATWMITAGVYAVKNSMGFSASRGMMTYIVGIWALLTIELFLL